MPSQALPDKEFYLITAVGILLFCHLFIAQNYYPSWFWYHMASINAVLTAVALIAEPELRKGLTLRPLGKRLTSIALGLFLAAGLYAVFKLGHILLLLVMPDATAHHVGTVYALKNDHSSLLIAGIIAIIIGPGEEIFWRGFVQRGLSLRLSPQRGFLISCCLYCGVHVFTGNPLLMIAALVAGAVWGLAYALTNRLWLVIASHVAWDLAMFLLAPLQSS